MVSGQVTPDTYIVDKATLNAKDTTIGPKAQQIVADGGQGTRLADVDEASRAQSSLTDDMLRQLSKTAIDIEKLYDGVPQDIEWAIVDTDLFLLQSRPITKVPVQPIEVAWEPPPPARYRRQIVENMRIRSVRCSRSYTRRVSRRRAKASRASCRAAVRTSSRRSLKRTIDAIWERADLGRRTWPMI